MSDFLDWHPSSKNAQKLYDIRADLQDFVYRKPAEGIDHLANTWKFGKVSEIWDDYIFDHCMRPVFDKNENISIKDAIRRYSVLDHLLFIPYVRREENPVRFRRAFWNINSYGLRIAQRFEQLNQKPRNGAVKEIRNVSRKKIAFVLKGPYKLAHVEFLHSFLSGCSVFSEYVEIFLLLLDDLKSAPKNLKHVLISSIAQYQDPYLKVTAYQQYCLTHQFDHICWVAPIQNFSLYMGMQLAPCQSYWSMKYHSVVLPTIQKYAGLGFGGESFKFDDKDWFRGRAFPDLKMSCRDQVMVDRLRSSCQIPKGSFVVGCFVRSEKLHDDIFWNSVFEILIASPKVHFVIASQSIPDKYLLVLENLPFELKSRFHFLGWVNTKDWAHALDVYFDSSPRGSCNTIFEAIEADVPVFLADSAHNRESSALPYLSSAASSLGLPNIPGVFSDEKTRLNACLDLLLDPEKCVLLASKQKKLLVSLKGRQYLFAKDYLNYFLDANFSLSSAQT